MTTKLAHARTLIGHAVNYAKAYQAPRTTESICTDRTDRLALLVEPSGRVRYLLDAKRSTLDACTEVLAYALPALLTLSEEPTEQACTDSLDVAHVDAADIDHAENVPGVTCGRTDMPMHTSGECPECFDALPTVPGLSYAEQETISEANYHAFVAMGVFPAQTFDAAPTRKQRRAERVRQNRLRKIERKARESTGSAYPAQTPAQSRRMRRQGKRYSCTVTGAHYVSRKGRMESRLIRAQVHGAPASTIASLREQLRTASFHDQFRTLARFAR